VLLHRLVRLGIAAAEDEERNPKKSPRGRAARMMLGRLAAKDITTLQSRMDATLWKAHTTGAIDAFLASIEDNDA